MTSYTSLNTLAYDHLRNMICNCEFEFGVIYSETKLAAQLSVSRTPMRDALNRLAQERYIDILPNRGFTLHSPTPDDIQESCHLRLMAETYCADVVAADWPAPAAQAVAERMEEALGQQSRLLESDADYSIARFWLDDLRFHEALLSYLHISSLTEPYESVMHIFMPHHLIRNPRLHEKDEKVMLRHRSTILEHAEIVAALKAADRDRLQAAIRGHIASSMKALNL